MTLLHHALKVVDRALGRFFYPAANHVDFNCAVRGASDVTFVRAIKRHFGSPLHHHLAIIKGALVGIHNFWHFVAPAETIVGMLHV